MSGIDKFDMLEKLEREGQVVSSLTQCRYFSYFLQLPYHLKFIAHEIFRTKMLLRSPRRTKMKKTLTKKGKMKKMANTVTMEITTRFIPHI